MINLRNIYFYLFISSLLTGCLGEGFTSIDSTEENNPQLANGIESYSNNCMSCHGAIGASNKKNSNFISIKNAISAVPQMNFLTLVSDSDLRAIELALTDNNLSPLFSIQTPSDSQNVTSSFIISGNCVQGSIVNLTGDFGNQTFNCSGSYSFLVSSSQSGSKNFLISQVLNSITESLNRIVNYSVGSGLSEKITTQLNDSCNQEGEDVSHTTIKRLTKSQFINSLKPLVREWENFYGTAKPLIDSIPDDVVSDSISTYLRYSKLSSSISFEHITAYHNVATAVANTATNHQEIRFLYAQHVEGVSNLNCWYFNSTSESCSDAFISSMGRRFYSRPLTVAELAEAEAVHDAEPEQVNGIQNVLYYFAMSPQFLFQLDIEGAVNNDILNLTQYELANKISLQLTNTIADKTMLNLAKDGLLNSSQEIDSAIDYLISSYSQDVKDTYWEFISEWLGKTKYEEFPLSDKLNGMVSGLFNPENQGGLIREGMKGELRNMFEFYTFDSPASFSTILTSTNSFSTDLLVSNIHNVGAWDRNPSSLISYPNNKKKGFLTTSSLLTQGGTTNNPFHTGGMIYKHVLCKQFGDTDPPEDLDPGEPLNNLTTTRDHFASLTPNGSSCMSCHDHINPIGFTFEEFDFLGRKRDGFERFFDIDGNYIDQLQIDSTASVNLSEQDIGVDGAMDLIDKIDQSKEAHACFAKQYFRFSQVRLETEKDSCTIKRAFEVSKNGTLLDIMKAVISDPNFARRRIEE